MSIDNHIYYTSWRTWQQESLQTPWDFWYLSEGNTYRPRNPHTPAVTQDEIKRAWQTNNQQFLDQLEINHVVDVKLAAFVPAQTEQHAQQQVLSVFGDAQFERVVRVDAPTQLAITALFERAAANIKR